MPPAPSGIDLQDDTELILLAAEHIAQLEFLDILYHSLILLINLLFGNQSLFYEIESETQLLCLLLKCGIGIDPEMQFLDLAHLRLSLVAVIPEVGYVSTQFLLLDLNFLGVDIKIAFESGCTLLYFLKLFECYHQLYIFSISRA